jgi:hypothetical protein
MTSNAALTGGQHLPWSGKLYVACPGSATSWEFFYCQALSTTIAITMTGASARKNHPMRLF